MTIWQLAVGMYIIVHNLQVQIQAFSIYIQCVPEKTEPWNNGMLRASCGVYDYYHIYFMKYD